MGFCRPVSTLASLMGVASGRQQDETRTQAMQSSATGGVVSIMVCPSNSGAAGLQRRQQGHRFAFVDRLPFGRIMPCRPLYDAGQASALPLPGNALKLATWNVNSLAVRLPQVRSESVV